MLLPLVLVLRGKDMIVSQQAPLRISRLLSLHWRQDRFLQRLGVENRPRATKCNTAWTAIHAVSMHGMLAIIVAVDYGFVIVVI